MRTFLDQSFKLKHAELCVFQYFEKLTGNSVPKRLIISNFSNANLFNIELNLTQFRYQMRISDQQEKTLRNSMENVHPRNIRKRNVGFARILDCRIGERHMGIIKGNSQRSICTILDIFSHTVFLFRSTISWAFILVWYAARGRTYSSTPTRLKDNQARWLSLLEANGTQPTLRFDPLWS